MTTYDDAAARPDTAEPTEGRRRATPAVTSEMVSATRERVADALSRPDGRQAGEDILGILRTSPTATRPASVVAVPTVAVPPTPLPAVQRPEPRSQPTAAGESTSVSFAPKKGARRLLGTALVLALLVTAGAGVRVYNDRTAVNIGITATLVVLLLVIWAIRAGSPLTLMTVNGGLLDVRQGGLHLKFDLSSHYTPIEVQGTPGQRGWRVLFGRGTLPPFVVDATMVDAKHFMDVLGRYRPQ